MSSTVAGGRRSGWLTPVAVTLCVALAAAACAGRVGHSRGRTATAGGTADVAYAGSLQLLNDHVLGPGFEAATGDRYVGRGGGSIGLAREIASGEISPGVFESIGSAPIVSLGPRRAPWWVRLASSPIVVAYNPRSRFASRLAAVAAGRAPLAELFSVLGAPGFLLGRTDPDTDPQGQAFYEMVELAEGYLHLPAGTAQRILGPPSGSREVFAETALEARLEAGQLDAASAFRSQAVQLHLPYVGLPPSIDFGDPALASAYAKASLRLAGGKEVHGVPLVVYAAALGRPASPASVAFVAYLLSRSARAAFARAGYQLLAPEVSGDVSAVPPEVRHELAS